MADKLFITKYLVVKEH